MIVEMSEDSTQYIFWVDGSGRKAKREARAHLIRELSRRKHWANDTVPSIDEVEMVQPSNPAIKHEAVPLLPKSSSQVVKQKEGPLLPKPSRQTVKHEDVLLLPKRSSSTGSPETIGSDTSLTAYASSTSPASSASSLDLYETGSPGRLNPTCLLQSNSDPFNSFPGPEFNTPFSREVYNAITFKTICAEIWDLKETASFNPLRDVIYPVSAQDPAAFGTFLAMTANVRSRYRQMEVETEAFESKLHSIRAVNQRLGLGPSEAVKDGTLIAIFGLAVLEAQFGDQKACTAHSKGLQQLLNQRGIENLHEHTQLFFGVCSMLSYPSSFTLASMSMSNNPKYSWAETSEPNMELRVEELIEFTKDVSRCLKSPCSVLGKRANTYKSRMFLHRTITRSAKKRFGQDSRLRYQDQCRFGALAYTHLLILEHEQSPTTLNRELDVIVEQLRGHKVHFGVASDILIWLLNQSPEALRIRNFERTWKTSRFMSVMKLLTDRALLEINDFLFDTLEGKTTRSNALRHFWAKSDIWQEKQTIPEATKTYDLT